MDFNKYTIDLHDDDKHSGQVISIDRLENLATELARSLKVDQKSTDKNLLKEIQFATKQLFNFYHVLNKDIATHSPTPGSDWFLDNFHIIEDQLNSIKRDLPIKFYDELPKVTEGEFKGFPRVYAIAQTYVINTDSIVNIHSIEKYVETFQRVTPLTIGELWAIAITFRISLILRLNPLVNRIIVARSMRMEADLVADKLLEKAALTNTKPEDLIENLSYHIKDLKSFSRPFVVQLIQRLRDQAPNIAGAFDHLEKILRSCKSNTEEIVKQELHIQASVQVTIGNIISSMRLISNIDWHVFFEAVSLVDPILNRDPAGAYHKMDRLTRDTYRKNLERMSRKSKYSEIEIAQKALDFSETHADTKRKNHVGYYLIDLGVLELEASLDYKSPFKERVVRFIDNNPGFVYFGILLLLIFLNLSILFKVFYDPASNWGHILGLVVLTIIPLSEFSLNILNYSITLIKLPVRMPRMNTEEGINEKDTTMVIVPCLLTNIETIQELISNLEVHYLANQDEHIYFSLLADFKDAPTETTVSDQELLHLTEEGIVSLNRRYQRSDIIPRFYLFCRARLFNPSEGKWICWERKRGKVMEFNRLLRGDTKTTFLNQNIDFTFLSKIEYAITLDADTQLPLQNARRLVGTIVHPLNQPVYCPKRKRIVAGYGILQPRISVSMISATKSRFSRIFSNNTGIDPYTTAVSDVYQDIFHEGSFTGKGLYHVDSFEKVVSNRVPDNLVLSHDLLEGSFARVGLVTDLELIDDFPSTFDVFSKRLHRWTRGDWQISLWLFPFVLCQDRKWVRNNLSLLSRWKIFDNLRRSLLAPTIILWLILSWTVLWGNPFIWTAFIIGILGFSVYAPSIHDLLRRRELPYKEHIKICSTELEIRLHQTFLMLIFMPNIAFVQIDAIIRSLFRMTISKKKLLEWVSFSEIQAKINKKFNITDLFSIITLFSLAVIFLIMALKPESLYFGLPIIVCWLLSPLAAHWLKQRANPKIKPLGTEDIQEFRRYGRMTWHFFETFAGEENNWLAPDNYQEDPLPVIATRTSPTNIGLQLLANLTAYDMGYIGLNDLVELCEKTIITLKKLERINGHFCNWYDTKLLEPLFPRYISTVDSGNLAGHFIVLKQACLRLSDGDYLNTQTSAGAQDTLLIISEEIKVLQNRLSITNNGSFKRILYLLEECKGPSQEGDWEGVAAILTEAKISLNQLVEDKSEVVFIWFEAMIQQVSSYIKDLTLIDDSLSERLIGIAQASEEFYMAMDFKFLFENERKIFSIGYNVSEGVRDNSYYDLLASEARLASFIAIAKGDIPDEHWFRLGRSLVGVVGSRALVSWSASMFEYLMPLLVMRRYGETLLDQTYDSVVLRQIEYGGQKNTPWGVSEAGYNARDRNFNYQYGPFGIPGLGLKRGLKDELVISPYSSMLAAMVFPHEALSNLKVMEKMNVIGRFGFHESIDYTGERILKNQKFVILKSYMAHHQGMSLISINNLLNRSVMQKRFHSEPRVKAIQLLLQEKIPFNTPLIKPREDETHVESHARFSDNEQTRIYVDPTLSTPRTQILSNGNYSVMMSTAGSGFSKCEDRMVTRWREDSTMDDWGQYIYIHDLTNKKTWSAGIQPTLAKPTKYEAQFSEDKIEIIRQDQKISTHSEIIISSEDNIEMRRISLSNNSDVPVEIEVTSYMEVVLAQARDDAAHSSFSNLFVQTEFRKEFNSLLANRRLRTKSESEVWGMHILTLEGEAVGPLQYETDRCRFIGRGRSVKNPIVLSNEIDLSGTTGAVLDPIFSLRQRIKIGPHQTARVTFSTGLVYSKEEALRVSDKYNDPHIFLRQVNLGWIKGQISLRHLNITSKNAHIYQRLASRILYLAPYLRTQSQTIISNKKNQSALWAYGISGDLPILLTRITHEKDMDMIRELLRAHEYLRLKGLKFDLLILNDHATSYLQNLQDELMRQILISGFHQLLDKPGGIFIRRSEIIPEDDLVLIKTVARLCLFANKGTLSDQLQRRSHDAELPPRFMPIAQKKTYPHQAIPVPELKFFNGLGGFTTDGREYVISLKEDKWTPAPWINVIANKNDFGFIISESGQGYTWSVNSRENRLTPWSNDAVSDPISEAIYIRDEQTGAIWSPTPLPIRSKEAYLIQHGQGYSKFTHNSNGFSHELTAFVPVEDTVKILRLRIKNTDFTKSRKISITSYVNWVLGFSKTQTSQTLVTTWDDETQSMSARNSYNNEFAERVAFLAHSTGTKSFTSDRKEFIGRNGTMTNPAALSRKNLSGKMGGGFDLCGSIQSVLDIAPMQEKEIIILLGQSETSASAHDLIKLYKDSNKVESTLDEVKEQWEEVLGTITIQTPNDSMDMLVNRWLLYQTLSCRIWARSAFYQSGGAYGYRDQLQDVMAMVFSHPKITRDQIKLAASRQFPEGDVQHWWHPPTGRGVRTRFSDDLLWLPFVTSYYAQTTGDLSILGEVVPFIETPPLDKGHDETYTQPTISDESATVFDHCLRTIDRSLKVGVHGLPLMGSGDWNDGMSRVGNLGKGESVWMAWFLIKTLKDFIPLCVYKNELKRAKLYQEHIKKLKISIEENAWDGEWYLRAFFDNGDKLGSSSSEECKIDAIAQSWSVISGAGDPKRSRMAVEGINKYLIDREERIIKLFTPPFDKSDADPGYIKGYVPGVRENGGQYTHAAIWTMMSYALLNDGKRATELFDLINPINRSTTLTGAQKYKVEPYVIAADVYSVEPHVGRGGWTWYTGSSSWMYRAALESILGFHIKGNILTIAPCIPPEWNEFKIKYRHNKTTYHITVLNHQKEATQNKILLEDLDVDQFVTVNLP